MPHVLAFEQCAACELDPYQIVRRIARGSGLLFSIDLDVDALEQAAVIAVV
jgi:hypothetical protein